MRTACWNAYNFFSWVIFEKWAAGSFCDIRGFASISKHPVSLFLEQILNRTTWRADQTRDECLVHQIRHLIPSSNFLGSSCTYNAASRYTKYRFPESLSKTRRLDGGRVVAASRRSKPLRGRGALEPLLTLTARLGQVRSFSAKMMRGNDHALPVGCVLL